jgi:hypothetical protein
MMDFSQKKRLVQAGIEAGRQAIPAVRAAIAAWPNKPDATTVSRN